MTNWYQSDLITFFQKLQKNLSNVKIEREGNENFYLCIKNLSILIASFIIIVIFIFNVKIYAIDDQLIIDVDSESSIFLVTFLYFRYFVINEWYLKKVLIRNIKLKI